MKFIDLFAGLGGFHLALSSLGHSCVFASELDEGLQDLYERNFGMRPYGDIRKVDVDSIPAHDILCSGSPCQPWSKAGEQPGLTCPKWGDLFDYVLAILNRHKPKFILFENVPNLTRHNEGQTWLALRESLENAGYRTKVEYYSPHEFGIPQIRERVFIVGRRGGLENFEWPETESNPRLSIQDVLDTEPENPRQLSTQVQNCLEIWQKFIKSFPKKEELPSFPIWSMEFGATYPYKRITPQALGIRKLHRYRGSHGKRLARLSSRELMATLPSYAKTEEDEFPHWKVLFIRQNRELYKKHKTWIDKWIPEILQFPPSLQKLEWNCKGEDRDIWKYVIQFRASGVRVKRPTTAPSLIAMTTTQVPIIAWEKRYMTPRECARLQSMDKLDHLPDASTRAFKALGNAVNSEVVRRIAEALVGKCAPVKSVVASTPKHHNSAHNRSKLVSSI